MTQWSVTGNSLIEFPPVICKRSLFMEKNNGALYKISRLTGDVKWRKKLGYLAASSPACAYGKVFTVVLPAARASAAGVSGRAAKGRKASGRATCPPARSPRRWSTRAACTSAPRTGPSTRCARSDGAVRWTYKAGGAVKGALALDRGRLIFGDYGGKVQAIRQRDGADLADGSSAGSFGTRRALLLDAGRRLRPRLHRLTDSFVYSSSAATGKLAWRHKTGGYVYSSPAVGNPPGGGRRVYIGSYDGKLYSFDARSGSVRWTHTRGGKISGGPVDHRRPRLLLRSPRSRRARVGASTGKEVWRTHRGAFNPGVSDGRRIYFLGYSSLFMLSSHRQAVADSRARQGLPPRKLTAAERRRARAEQKRVRQRATNRRIARHQRFVKRRVALRRAALRATPSQRRKGQAVCFRANGRRVCRVPRPLVCVKSRTTGRVTCRTRKP